jgi:uncharacterized protein
MTPFLRRVFLSVGILGGLTPCVGAEPPLPGVQDEAELFKLETVEKAQGQIREIRETLHLDLFVETVKSVPEKDRKRVRNMYSYQVTRYFAAWAKERAATAGVDGVYILICTEPRNVQVVVWPESRDKCFPRKDREQLRAQLATQLRNNPDRALLDAVDQVGAALRANHPTEPPADSSSPWNGWLIGGIIVGMLIAWIALGMFRATKAEPAAEQGGGQPAGFMPGLLGGMFGAVAGYWVYDRLFRGGPREPAPPLEDVRPDEEKQVPTPAVDADDPARSDNENATV